MNPELSARSDAQFSGEALTRGGLLKVAGEECFPGGAGEVTLDAASVEAVALRVVELLRDEGLAAPGRLLSAAELALRLGVERSWVYEHAEMLGARRLGDGRRARLRFDLAEAERAVACVSVRTSAGADSGAVEPKRPRRRRRSSGTGVHLLPIRGREAA